MAKAKKAPNVKKGARGKQSNPVEDYKKVLPRFTEYASTIKQVLEGGAKRLAPEAIVQSRPKDVASFAGKIQRRRPGYDDPLNKFTDLCGARVIAHTSDEVAAVCKYIRENFIIDWDNSLDVSQRLKTTEFGYRSVHYIVEFKPGVFPSNDVNIKIPQRLFGLKAEIQVRTILEHAWSDFAHERSYKSAFKVPEKWLRELAGVAAMLEKADSEFSRINKGLKKYSASYSDFMNKEQMQAEIKLLESTLRHDRNNAELAHRIGKLAIELEDWDGAIRVLGRYQNSGNQPGLRDLGVAICKKYGKKPKSNEYKQGQEYLRAACEMDTEDTDAIASLAGTWKKINPAKAKELYRRAYEIDPSDPYPLGNYLEYVISDAGNTAMISCMAPVLGAAIQRCRDYAAVRMNLPWAYYDMGKFYLLLNEPYESLAAYAKAIEASTAGWMVDTSYGSLVKLAAVKDELPGYEWVRRMLLTGRVAKFPEDVDATDAREEIERLATADCGNIEAPVVIVGGGCDINVETRMHGYRKLIMETFHDYRGTIISGGSTAGISGLVGELQKQHPRSIKTIGYVPSLTPADVSTDKRYSRICYTDGNDFTPLEPLQNWVDLIASGITPAHVRVLGINGGAIAAAEYRIALALGAQVAVIEESGRAAAQLAADDQWSASGELERIPADPTAARVFIGLERDHILETMAKAIHEEYRKEQTGIKKRNDPAMASWDKLGEGLKEANREQAAHIGKKLKRIGCSIHKVEGRAPALMTFTDEEVEAMAEMEHERWNEQKFRESWKYGKKRDHEKMTSPYLVSWSSLPEDVKEWDRQTVRKIPGFLADTGFEIHRDDEKE